MVTGFFVWLWVELNRTYPPSGWMLHVEFFTSAFTFGVVDFYFSGVPYLTSNIYGGCFLWGLCSVMGDYFSFVYFG